MINDDRVREADGHREGGAVQPPMTKVATRRHGRRWLMGGVLMIAAAGVVAYGIMQRRETMASLQVTADDLSVPKVTLVSPKPGPSSRTLTLPGQTQAWYQAPLFAQVTGYVQMWFKDYGAVVHKGDLLATIDTPDLDQELQQAAAQLNVAQARLALARTTAQRWQKLAGTQAVSQETVDVNNAAAKEAASEAQAAQFNVARFRAQEAFKRVVAPFDGVVTARNTDIGSFVNAAGGSAEPAGRTQQLFTVSDVHQIRVFVSVPQDYSADLKPGLKATVTLPQFPDQHFNADITTTAKAFDTNTRTVLTELVVANPAEAIFPGGYAEVTFTVPADPKILIIPEQAMLFRAQGLQVAVVGKDDRVHLQDISIGRNLGDSVQVTEGLQASDTLIANPSDGLLEGQPVQVVQVPPQNSDDEREAAASAAAPVHHGE